MNNNKHLVVSGILFTLVLFMWPILMLVAQPEGTVIEQLDWISKHSGIYRLQFFLAFLIAPAILYLMWAQLGGATLENRIVFRLGWVFLTAYLVLNSISYASQAILVPKFLVSGMKDLALSWYFNSDISIAYFCNQTGYAFWGVGAFILFGPLMTRKGIIRYLGIIYGISALLSLVAFLGLVFDNEGINSLTLPAGLVLIPVGILTVIWGLKERVLLK